MEHYRYHRIYVKETRAERTSNTVQFLPTHCKIPYVSSIDKALEALTNLVSVISKVKLESPFSLKYEEIESVKNLAKMFKPRSTSESIEELRMVSAQIASPRVLPAGPPQLLNPIPTPRAMAQFQPTLSTNNQPSPTMVRGPSPCFPTINLLVYFKKRNY